MVLCTLQRGAHGNDFRHLSRPACCYSIGPSLVCDVLTASPRVSDIELIASELMTNALQHTAAGRPGGVFTLTISTGASWASIEVSDTGDSCWQHDAPKRDTSNEHGRGLVLVAALADRYGHDVDEYGQTVWAEVSW